MSTTTTERSETPRRAGRATPGFGGTFLDILVGLFGAALVFAVATVPLLPREQAVFAVCAAVIFLVINRFPGKGVTMFLVVLSLSVSLRYIYWRLTETLDFPSIPEMLLGSGLVAAEIYAILTLVLGYIQTVWPLERQPKALPDDPDTWPTVDVYIPTYNEPMAVVRATVLAAIAMDWPRDKMKVWLLDDGRREEFRQFADACGVGYITRNNNAHAKAGNLNNAMTQTDGEFVCIFDCDHVPTRAFLQMTMGWLVAEPNIALVQTPHHFYSPDPFQRNLAAGTRVPSEGNLFYGLIQPGNDYWNACFFCGSCAVLRRTALDEIGGIAVETVTEDAHTMLKLHRRGWDSAYLKMPLAAGLATERLALHIGQRIRWARGMLQILRIDNPMFGRGLTLGQRICYLQAMGHFLFALPRLVFLTAPLAYLLAGQNIIAASPLAITAYALPHIFHSVATNSRLQRNWRHSFWSEIYETVLALFLVRVTIVTLLSPRRGKFNVTAKGGLLENGFFDLGAVYPNLILAFLVIAGVIRGLVSLIFFHNEPLIFQALLLNTIWASLSLLVVLAALAVGRETRQIRSRARLNALVPVALHLPDGRVINATTRDLSQGGGSLTVERPQGFVDGSDIDIEFGLGDAPLMVPARVLRWEQQSMQVRWQPTTLEEEARVVQAVFSRADAWTDWAAFPIDRPLASLWRVLVSIRGLFRPRDTQSGPAGGAGVPPAIGGPQQGKVGGRGGAVAGSAAMVALLLLMPVGAQSQTRPVAPSGQTVVRPIPQPVPTLMTQPAPAAPRAGIAAQAAAPQPAAASPGLFVPLPPLVGAAPVAGQLTGAAALANDNRPGVRHIVYNLRQLGAQGPLALRGTSELQGVEFGIRSDEVVTGAQLNLTGAMSPALIPEFSNVTVTLNEQYVGTIPVTKEQQNFTMELPVSPVFFQDMNRLNFRFTGRYTPECNDPLSGLLWATVSDTSTLTLTLERLPPQRDLSRLPLPFFDAHEKQPLTLPVVMSASPGNDALKAAGIVSSWFGGQAGFRGATFPVQGDAPTEGNAVMIVVASDGRGPSFLPAINGPTLGVIANPNDPLASILLVAGRNGDEVVAAATTLVLGSRGLGSDVALVQPVTVPNRVAYDAPNWMATDRPVKFGELVDAADLQSYGYTGLLHVPFRTAPDFYTWRDRGFPMDLRYRAPPGPVIDAAPSRLDVGINGIYLNSFSLTQNNNASSSVFSRLFDLGGARPDARLTVPAYDVFGYNDLQFYFDAKPLHRGDCVAIPTDLRMSVDPDSTIDLSRGYRFAQMPNLQFFVNSGFPFTRMADLSETAVVLPDRPSAVEMSAYLNLMGRLGALTGYPPVRMEVIRPDAAGSMANRDFLVIGTIARLQGIGDLLRNGPLTISANRMSLSLPTTLDSLRKVFDSSVDADRDRAAAGLQAAISDSTAVMVGAQSPYSRSRSVVALLAASPQSLENTVDALHDSTAAPLIQGDLSILSGGKVSAYRVSDIYTVGSLPFWLYPSYLLRGQPYSVVLLMVIGSILGGLALFWAMRRRSIARLAATANSRSTTR
jgi:cellulose synthase (UDP-forming)